LKKKKKILILGGSGLLGLNFIRKFSSEYEILATYNQHKPNKSLLKNTRFIKLKINKNFKNFKKTIFNFKPDYVFNFLAISEIEICEKNKENCKKVFFESLKNALRISKKYNCKFIHISTDTVYNEKNEYNSETSKLGYKNYYTYLKILCEKYLKKNYSNYLILRGRFFGYSLTKKNFFEQILFKLKNNQKIICYDNMYSTPLGVVNFCENLKTLLEKDKKGIFNISSNTKISRYKFAILVSKIFNLNSKFIIRGKYILKKHPTKKNLNTSIDNSKIKKINGIKIETIRKSLIILKNEK
tara:strand:- start:848 stop:1744 length:897 start_codon:yes stop_codon:yes gene_type:complete